MRAAGAWVFSNGLLPPSSATVLRPGGDDVLMTDGPFAEGKEHLGGFTIVEAPDLDVGARLGPPRSPSRPPCPSRCGRSPGERQPSGSAEIARVFRSEYGRSVAVLYRVFGDLDIAEDAVQDAFATAVERWPVDGLPPSPAGWIITTARRRAIDRLRREATGRDRIADAAFLHAQSTPDPTADEAESPVDDDRLRLIFTCCHPALAPASRVALTLRLLGGLTTAEIARAFLVPETDDGRSGCRGRRRRSGMRGSRTASPATPICPIACGRCWRSST